MQKQNHNLALLSPTWQHHAAPTLAWVAVTFSRWFSPGIRIHTALWPSAQLDRTWNCPSCVGNSGQITATIALGNWCSKLARISSVEAVRAKPMRQPQGGLAMIISGWGRLKGVAASWTPTSRADNGACVEKWAKFSVARCKNGSSTSRAKTWEKIPEAAAIAAKVPLPQQGSKRVLGFRPCRPWNSIIARESTALATQESSPAEKWKGRFSQASWQAMGNAHIGDLFCLTGGL